MNRIRLFAVLCSGHFAVGGTVLAEEVTPEAAADHIGDVVDVRGTVVATGFTQTDTGTWMKNLYFGDDVPRHVFRVRFPNEDLRNGDLLPTSLELRELRVRGRIESAADGPRITVPDAIRIEVLPVNVGEVLQAPLDSAPERDLYAVAWRQVLLRGGYAGLEKAAVELVAEESRFVSGLWKISSFMEGLSQAETQREEDWRSHEEALERWREEFPESATQQITLASFLVRDAWRARGSGWASTVTEEGWRVFRERLSEAKAVFDALPRDKWSPYAYSSWLGMATGLGLPTTETEPVFEECVARWPEFHSLYFAEAMRLLPRWHGRPGEWEEWLADRTSAGDEFSDELYARVVWAQSGFYRGEGGVFEGSDADWNRVKRGFEVMRKRYPDSSWNLNAYAKFSSDAGDRATAAALVKDLEGREITRFWRGWSSYERFRRWAEGEES